MNQIIHILYFDIISTFKVFINLFINMFIYIFIYFINFVMGT